MTSDTLGASRWPLRGRGNLNGRRLALLGMLVAAVAWAFAWGAHEHGSPVVVADLSKANVYARYVVDASTGVASRVRCMLLRAWTGLPSRTTGSNFH